MEFTLNCGRIMLSGGVYGKYRLIDWFVERHTFSMKIAFISNSAKGEYTGRLNWARILKEKGHEVFFVLPKEEQYIREIESQGIPVERWCLKRGKRHILNKIFAVIDLAKKLKCHDFDIVHSFGHEANICCDAARLLNGRAGVVNHITGLGSEFTERTSFLGKCIIALYWILSPVVSLFLFENEDDRAFFSNIRDDKKVILLASGVNVDYFNPSNIDYEKVALIKKELEIEKSVTVVTFIGRLLVHKGLHELIEAWKEILKDKRDVCLLIIGEIDKGNPSSIEEEDIQWLSSLSGVKVLGRRDDIKELLYLTDIFVNPSYREGLPRTNIEALAMSTPVITTDVPGCRDTIRDGIEGFIVPPEDKKSLARAIIRLIEDEKLRMLMANNARERAENAYSIEKIIDEVLSMYGSLAVKKPWIKKEK